MWGAVAVATCGSCTLGYLCLTLAEQLCHPRGRSRSCPPARKALSGKQPLGLLSPAVTAAPSLGAMAISQLQGAEALRRASRPCGLWLLHAWPSRVVYSSAMLRSQASEAGQQALGLPAWEFLARGGMTRTPFCA